MRVADLDSTFKILGFSMRDIVELRRFMDCHMLKIEDLRNVEVRKYFHERKFILDAIMRDGSSTGL